MPAFDALYIGTTNLVAVEELTNKATGALITSATVTLEEIVDEDGAQLSGSANLALDYNANAVDSRGQPVAATYQGNLPASATTGLSEGTVYYLCFKAVLSDLVTRWRRPAKARNYAGPPT